MKILFACVLLAGCAISQEQPRFPEAQIFGQKQVHYLTEEEILQKSKFCKNNKMQAKRIEITTMIGNQFVPETVEVKCIEPEVVKPVVVHSQQSDPIPGFESIDEGYTPPDYYQQPKEVHSVLRKPQPIRRVVIRPPRFLVF